MSRHLLVCDRHDASYFRDELTRRSCTPPLTTASPMQNRPSETRTFATPPRVSRVRLSWWCSRHETYRSERRSASDELMSVCASHPEAAAMLNSVATAGVAPTTAGMPSTSPRWATPWASGCRRCPIRCGYRRRRPASWPPRTRPARQAWCCRPGRSTPSLRSQRACLPAASPSARIGSLPLRRAVTSRPRSAPSLSVGRDREGRSDASGTSSHPGTVRVWSAETARRRLPASQDGVSGRACSRSSGWVRRLRRCGLGGGGCGGSSASSKLWVSHRPGRFEGPGSSW